MRTTTIAVAVLLAAGAARAELPSGFAKALHAVETSGRTGAVLGDGGAARGPLQIHRGYWLDAVQFDKTIGGRYEDVQSLEYATRIVDAYMRRYARRAYDAGDCETLARVHNGGPSGATKSATLKYWERVKRWLR